MDDKQTYTRKEYYQLFDDMDKNQKLLRDEVTDLNDRNKRLNKEVKFQKDKVIILQKTISLATDDFLKLSSRYAI